MQESTYKSAGSVHGCALSRQDELLTFVEDVGRHNAIDTIAGSRSGITQMGHQLAVQPGLARFGRATNRHFICYSGFERFGSQPEPPRAA